MATENYNLSYEEWFQKYRPIINPFSSSSKDCFFPLGQAEITRFLSDQNPLCVWTRCDCEGYISLVNGFHSTNRTGHYVTTQPYELGDQIEVLLQEPVLEEQGLLLPILFSDHS